MPSDSREQVRLLQRARWSWLVILSLLVGVAAVVATLVGYGQPAQWFVSAYVIAVSATQAWQMIRSLLHGRFGLDLLAIIAMVSTVVVGEYWAGLVIVLMLAGGRALEEYANRRARAELSALLGRAPTIAHQIDSHGGLVDVPIGRIGVGDEVLIQPGEVVPVDGQLLSDVAVTDESQLTGESMPVEHQRGDAMLSGSINGAQAMRMLATATAASSQYQQIVDLVKEASESRPPIVRLADRYALPFTLLALTIGVIAVVVSGEPTRFAEVLVVATPCPLLLAAPVAFVAGISRAARAGIVIKGGATLEQLSRVKAAAFDKTGTLTTGAPTVVDILAEPWLTEDRLLSAVASVEQYSGHVLANTLVHAATARGLDVSPASAVRETTAAGVSGEVGGHHVDVGKKSFVAGLVPRIPDVQPVSGRMAIFVAVDGRFAGRIDLADELRENAAATLRELTALGVRRTVMLTGDLTATARHIADALGITAVYAECLPQDKVDAVAGLQPRPVMMVGDGVNDAPVLAAADIGIAMGARGSTAASESADVVILLDDIMRAAYAVRVGHETTRIALQAIWLGIGISVALMVVASFGVLPALLGAILQEGVDVVTILFALRARLGTFGPSRSPSQLTASTVRTVTGTTGD